MTLAEFLHMGGYAPYVWGSYVLTAGVLLAHAAAAWCAARRAQRRLAAAMTRRA